MPPSPPRPRTRRLTVIAQDPGVRHKGRILRARVEIPAEELVPGPCGCRVQVIDYDATTDTHYQPLPDRLDEDPFADASDAELLRDPRFHCQNAYALVMRTLGRFEHALGRRVSWGLRHGHQIKIAPHAFADANAFYSPDDYALLFGYFPRGRGRGHVLTCLSHDVVVHEATHALLDGLRSRYADPSSPDQAAFHEGFADVVALLSVFSLPAVVGVMIDLAEPAAVPELVSKGAVELERLRRSSLLGLAEEMGEEMTAIRGNALRRSAELEPTPFHYLESAEFEEPHRRGEILVAAMINAFLEVWAARLADLGEVRKGYLSRSRVVEEGAAIADTLLTMAIRALDYSPSVDVHFGDYLSALVTADAELRPDDSKYGFRRRLLASFRAFGVDPAAGTADGQWEPPPRELSYDRTHFDSMRREPDEVFRFVWENRGALDLSAEAFTEVQSLRPSLRVGPDGFILHETVAEYWQLLDVQARELVEYGIEKPYEMEPGRELKLYGGGALIFDEYGRLKYHVHNRLLHPERQTRRLSYLWRYGYFKRGSSAFRTFSSLHRYRAAGMAVRSPEEW